eukprot:Sdes_comp20268_c0_seq3m13806
MLRYLTSTLRWFIFCPSKPAIIPSVRFLIMIAHLRPTFTHVGLLTASCFPAVLSVLILKDETCANQFADAVHSAPTALRLFLNRLFDGAHCESTWAQLDMLSILCHLARSSPRHVELMKAIDILTILHNHKFQILSHSHAAIICKGCSLIGNLCRYGATFYAEFKQ